MVDERDRQTTDRRTDRHRIVTFLIITPYLLLLTYLLTYL